MAKHDDLLDQGPREAPEPETAEQRSQKLGLKSAGGVVAGGGVVAAKAGAIGGLGKLFIWMFAWNGVSTALRIGGWIGLLVVLAIVVAAVALYRRRRLA
jgi:hypothetical protein